ncbi:Hypothetical protein DEACI_1165 [Acididesulfobacillus acetoxydans]|uniref:Uncharacterized protein n=1 Tax=Acididesulfobacillus acetoxydans TaxID=1561005 RepID=A0A8S0WEY0_9FIRM|nr:hypothetical protein [Acididesulfobacillus acetoxydans]CAA7600512.1 Hypothetical protein DEACI_1165 [Acididesulfobacillus acetoxydans]CEJ06646.1 Hypothetical protein DEACI_1095 [Acididesulfobacillus acetoxydans]
MDEDERIGEVKAISPIRPTRKVALINPRRGRRELRYQIDRYQKARKAENAKPESAKPESVKRVVKKMPDVSKGAEACSGTALNRVEPRHGNINRVAYDRTIILGE